jgi:hypothetical protein
MTPQNRNQLLQMAMALRQRRPPAAMGQMPMRRSSPKNMPPPQMGMPAGVGGMPQGVPSPTPMQSSPKSQPQPQAMGGTPQIPPNMG